MRKQAAIGRGYITKGTTTFKSKGKKKKGKKTKKEINKNKPKQYNTEKKKKSNPEIERLGEKIPILTIGNREYIITDN